MKKQPIRSTLEFVNTVSKVLYEKPFSKVKKMDTKTQLSQIKLNGNRLIVDLACTDGNLKFTVIDGLATKKARQWLAARSHLIKFKKWAYVDLSKKEIAELKAINEPLKNQALYVHRVVYRLTLINSEA
jgi:hypothetical protein